MARYASSAEYLPPLPTELTSAAWKRIASVPQGIPLTDEIGVRIDSAVCTLFEDIARSIERPKVRDVRRRLNALVKLLETEQDAGRLSDLFYSLLRQDLAGDVLAPLVIPHYLIDRPLRTLSSDRLAVARKDVLARLRDRQAYLDARYSGRRGREPQIYLDDFILRLASIWRDCGKRPHAAYDYRTEDRQTPFVKFVTLVAHEGIGAWAPELARDSSFESGALEERVRVALSPTAAERRRIKSRRYSQK